MLPIRRSLAQLTLPVLVALTACRLDGGSTNNMSPETPGEDVARALGAALRANGIPAVFEDEVPLPAPAVIELANGARLDAYGFEATWEEAATGSGHAITGLFGWSGFSSQDLTFDRELWVKAIVGEAPAPIAAGTTLEWTPVVYGSGPSLDAIYVDYTRAERGALVAASFRLGSLSVDQGSTDCGTFTDSTAVDCTAWLGRMVGEFSIMRSGGAEHDGLEQPPLPFDVPMIRVRYRY